MDRTEHGDGRPPRGGAAREALTGLARRAARLARILISGPSTDLPPLGAMVAAVVKAAHAPPSRGLWGRRGVQ